MCLILLAWRPGHAHPLVMAANRDEFYDRPTLPLHAWKDVPGLYAGRDELAGGTWLGVGPDGRFAALTNIRDPRQPPFGRSRGELSVQFLADPRPPAAFLDELANRAGDYSGFNLLLGDSRELWFFSSREGQPRQLPAGLYALSNADLDTPWPKSLRGKAALESTLAAPDAEQLLALLHDSEQAAEALLPDTGIGSTTERLLSSIFIASRNYGTRASTSLIVDADGTRELVERSYGPYGSLLGEVRLNP
ncbi:NRDE family protein [Pseudomonas sp. RIT-PI-AD]|uniref:NRDE family protein n=1 Tax=Pseudomonas sp. RIT-PI-AD TaxID=3035294 RepID=UPI0021D816A8|nr:NRDE family protein [Pseudomonas sp. RIT-PI-AD]